MENQSKKTLGQLANEFFKPNEVDPGYIRDYTLAVGKDMVTILNETVESGLKCDAYGNKDFYVVCMHDIEKLTQVPRNRFFHRLSCPTPLYQQSVWKYHRLSGKLEFLWSLPTQKGAQEMIMLYKDNDLRDEYIPMAQSCILFNDGRLKEWVEKENKEISTIGFKLIEKAE